MTNQIGSGTQVVYQSDAPIPKIDFLVGWPTEIGGILTEYTKSAKADGAAAVASQAFPLPDGRICVQAVIYPPTTDEQDASWSRTIIRQLIATIDGGDASGILDEDIEYGLDQTGYSGAHVLATFCAQTMHHYVDRVKAASKHEDNSVDDTPDDGA